MTSLYQNHTAKTNRARMVGSSGLLSDANLTIKSAAYATGGLYQ
jgi:hypothetical protein